MVHIPFCKNDQAGVGDDRLIHGEVHSLTGALSLMNLYAQSIQHPFPSAHVTTAWPVVSPLGVVQWDRPISTQNAYDDLREALVAVGIDGDLYKWHSLRAGPATAAGERGVPESVIMLAGGWRSASAARTYIHVSEDVMVEASAAVLAPQPLRPPTQPFRPRPPATGTSATPRRAGRGRGRRGPNHGRAWGPDISFE